jgi:hypothetical protein
MSVVLLAVRVGFLFFVTIVRLYQEVRSLVNLKTHHMLYSKPSLLNFGSRKYSISNCKNYSCLFNGFIEDINLV